MNSDIGSEGSYTNQFKNEMRSYQVGDCTFAPSGTNPIQIQNQNSDHLEFECGFNQVNVTEPGKILNLERFSSNFTKNFIKNYTAQSE